MDKFEANLNSYHSLNRQAKEHTDNMSRRMEKATPEECQILWEEEFQYFETLGKQYKALGEEMVEIMKPIPWWKFWKLV